MDTTKLNKSANPAVRMIGHQGIHHLEVGNTCSGFVAAGNRTYWGIETDVHVTKDGQYIIIHDDNTINTTGDDYVVEETDCATLRSLVMLDYTDGGSHTRGDLRLPLLSEYIRICRKYEKKAVLEIKNPVAPEHIKGIVDEVDSILIDEARTPLIISGPAEDSSDLYRTVDAIVAGNIFSFDEPGKMGYDIC